jgi:lipopolysaccharide transport system permease protein
MMLWQYRELLRNLVLKDLRLKYRNSVLGFLWSLLTPLAMILVYSIAFKYILRVQLENFTLFLFTGILPWMFFSATAVSSTFSLVSNAGLVKQIHFPLEILVLASVLFNLAQFLLALAIFFPVLVLLQAKLGWLLLLYPAVLLLQVAFTTGVALVLSAVTVYYQDVKYVTEVALMILFWVTPVLYHLSMVPERGQTFFKLNPMAAYISAYQDIIYWGRYPSAETWTVAFIAAGLMLIFGGWVFHNNRRSIVEAL